MEHTDAADFGIYPGASGIKRAYTLALSSKTLDIVCLSTRYRDTIGSFFEETVAPALAGIRTREILRDTAGNRNDANGKDGEIHQVRFLSGATGESESDMLIGDDFAVLISFRPEAPAAIVIRNQDIVASMKIQFSALWPALT